MGEAVKVIAKNSKAYHDYFIEEKFCIWMFFYKNMHL